MRFNLMIIMMNNLYVFIKLKPSTTYNHLAYLQIGSADEEWNMNIGISREEICKEKDAKDKKEISLW